VKNIKGSELSALIGGFDPGRFALCALLHARFAPFNVGTGKIKSNLKSKEPRADLTPFSLLCPENLIKKFHNRRSVVLQPCHIHITYSLEEPVALCNDILRYVGPQ